MSARAVTGRALALALALSLAGALPASAEDAQALFEKGVAALQKDDAPAAVAALEEARTLAPRRADVAYQLARAYEQEGRTSDAIRYYAEVERLDPQGAGASARTDRERLRAHWFSIELDEGESDLRAGRFEKARDAFAKAEELARAGDRTDRVRAFRGTARTAATELAASALKDRPKRTRVALVSLAAGLEGTPFEDAARLVDEELLRAFRSLGAEVASSAAGSPADPAALSVRGVAGQRIVLRVEDAQGATIARTQLAALLEATSPNALPPETISLDLSIECERDDKARPGRPEPVPVTEGATVKSGDRFRLRARTSRDAWLYAFIFDSQGQATLIYPGTEKLFPALETAGVRTPNPVPGKRDAVVPPPPPRGEPYWFYFDDHLGTETFYVAASLEPLADVEGLVKEIRAEGEKGRAAAKKLAQALRDRSVGTDVQEGEAKAGASHLELIRGRGAVVRFVSVEHR